MGIDFLDIVFRIEKAFGAKIPRGVIDADVCTILGGKRKPGRHDFTVGGLHRQVCDVLRRQGYDVPPDSWQCVRRCVSDALGVPIDTIQPDSLLFNDLGAA